jgi:asparagine synthase (glutamine-hydrolysing)
MCGIAGILAFEEVSNLAQRVRSLCQALVHRGPDAGGVWLDPQHRVAIAHRRLSIMDPQHRSDQPMTSQSGRFVLSYNGEIYNWKALRAQLESRGQVFQTSSDTEVLLQALEAWGVEACLDRIDGMFAFAVWDQHERRLSLCRDRLGIKPCYWMRNGSEFLFASEIGALLQSSGQRHALNPEAIRNLLDYGYIASPHTISQAVFQLEPGQMLTIRANGDVGRRTYWTAVDRKLALHGSFASVADDTLQDDTDACIRQAVEACTVADVPLGTFLSGGIDSTLVTAIAVNAQGPHLKTFSMGYAEKNWSEADCAAAVAAHLGTDHHCVTLAGADAVALAEDLADTYSEPFADFSQLPTLAICRYARQHVKVCLSGDGGDELFGGYTRYGLAPPAPSGLCHPGSDVDRQTAYRSVMRLGQVSSFDGDPCPPPPADATWQHPSGLSSLDRMQLDDLRRYMGDGILTKVDRASMSAGLEVRIPLLTTPVVDLALSLPERARRGPNGLRSLQKAVAFRHVPERLLNSRKQGFGFPVDVWLRGAMRDWADDLLALNVLRSVPWLNVRHIRQLWQDHRSGRSDHHWQLWPVLMYVLWYRRNAHYFDDSAVTLSSLPYPLHSMDLSHPVPAVVGQHT